MVVIDLFRVRYTNLDFIAFIASLITTTAPLIEVEGFKRRRRAGFSAAVYYALMWLHFAGWSGYGRLMPDEEFHWAVRVSNSWGCVSCLYYCHQIYQYLTPKAKHKALILNTVCLILGLALWVATYHGLTSPVEEAYATERAVGLTAALISMLWNMTPVLVIPWLLRNPNEGVTEVLSLPVCIMYNCSSALWCLYGLALNDPFISACNLVGGLANFTHLVVLLFHESTEMKGVTNELGDDGASDYGDNDSDCGGTGNSGMDYLLPVVTPPSKRGGDTAIVPIEAHSTSSAITYHHKSLVPTHCFSPAKPSPSLPSQHQGSTTPNRRSKQR